MSDLASESKNNTSVVIEIFRSDDYVPDGEIPLLPFLRAVLGDVIGTEGDGPVQYRLSFYRLRDLTADTGSPSVVNLRASHGFVRVRASRDGVLLYQHPHPVRELVGEPLRHLLRQRDPDVTHWGYGLRGPGLSDIPLARPAPQVAHETRASARRRRPAFTVEEVPAPEPPGSTLAALGADAPPPDRAPAGGHPVAVVIPGALRTALIREIPFSGEIEEGGFLAGEVYRDADRPGGYLVRVTAAIPAERTGASMIGFTFTGESFLRVSEQLAARGGGDVLLGWYHTHLFAATDRSGLSSVDVELHRSTFRRPWQVAALVNITGDGRVLRFYHGDGDDSGEMTMVPYWTAPS